MRRALAAYARMKPDQEVFKVGKAVKGYMKKYKDTSLEGVDKAIAEATDNLSNVRVKYNLIFPTIHGHGVKS